LPISFQKQEEISLHNNLIQSKAKQNEEEYITASGHLLFCELRNPGARRRRILLCYKDAKEEEPFDGQPKEEEIR